MSNDYTVGVRLFGGPKPYIDENGDSYKLRHESQIDPSAVKTDGAGNVTASPLVWKKPCAFRPERYVRGALGGKPWRDSEGERRLGNTPCDTCKSLSPGVFEACGVITSERVDSGPAIRVAFDAWDKACGDAFGPRCFDGPRGKLWNAFLQAIIDHGGWDNINDDQVALERLQRRDRRAKNHSAAKQARREREKAARRVAKAITPNYLSALQVERDCRAAELKRFRTLANAGRWLKMLSDDSCERIADVWQARDVLARGGLDRITAKAIAERMKAESRRYDHLELDSLGARVADDLKRIAKLEDDRAGKPVWASWRYREPANAQAQQVMESTPGWATF